ncbi:uncharacterized protein N7446_010504 [Penicillium canescens]|uniref:Uncharacterized protein n=1 Tax=Penicillium canescens TaxID=5083 RepID=A0AAD6ICK7_PENCN|nr:uncharacterized protein N7446_010504 [Penicillium canescens]KAJ6041616.1 hypothetical protein N7460_007006 [Penicillium canescens]KAJ6050395.1 hypothetical protein N7446_010504 [Penicillium canescens]KAJ6064695.1 hypothetical protein N7444_000348 [Penicillium canescens]
MQHETRKDHVALKDKALGPISILAPFSALIISVTLVIYFLIRFYVLEGFLIRRVYGSIYTDMSELNRRGFVNHHIAGFTKIVILIVAAYPFICITFSKATFQAAYALVTMGDILVVVAQALIAMYIFELLYRVKLSPVAVIHHIGTILIGQTAIAISFSSVREPDAEIEFVLCTVWGAFDTISEFFPHVAIILYRVFPKRHHFLSRVFLLSCFSTAVGTFSETVVTMWLFGSLWSRWRLAFKVVTPLLHIAFSAAQIHGSLVFWRMYRRQQRYMKNEGEDIEKDESPDMKLYESGDLARVGRRPA